MTGFTFDTAHPSQVKGLQGYTLDPIFTLTGVDTTTLTAANFAFI